MDELDELRLKIAKAKGTYDYDVIAHQGITPIYGWIQIVNGKKYMAVSPPPDWPRDIAAAWELENEIPESEHPYYTDCLIKVIYADYHALPTKWDFVHATPEQRSRAYLAWKEVQG